MANMAVGWWFKATDAGCLLRWVCLLRVLSSKLPVSCKCDPLGIAATPSSSYLTKAFERRLSRGNGLFCWWHCTAARAQSPVGKRNILVNCGFFFLFCDSLKPNSFFSGSSQIICGSVSLWYGLNQFLTNTGFGCLSSPEKQPPQTQQWQNIKVRAGRTLMKWTSKYGIPANVCIYFAPYGTLRPHVHPFHSKPSALVQSSSTISHFQIITFFLWSTRNRTDGWALKEFLPFKKQKTNNDLKIK